jgi:hypothetical protein
MQRQKSIWKIVLGSIMLATYLTVHQTGRATPPASEAEALGRSLAWILLWLGALILIILGFRGRPKTPPSGR